MRLEARNDGQEKEIPFMCEYSPAYDLLMILLEIFSEYISRPIGYLQHKAKALIYGQNLGKFGTASYIESCA